MTANFVAGGYTATYNAKALGQAAEGFRLDHRFYKRLVTGDAEGDTVQDSIYRGREQRFSCRLIEALEAGIPDLTEPYSSPRGTVGTQGTIGVMDIRNDGGVSPTALALSLVMTAVAGTSAAEDGPATITMPLTQLLEDFPVEVLYAPDLREVPIQCRVFPNVSTGVFYTVT